MSDQNQNATPETTTPAAGAWVRTAERVPDKNQPVLVWHKYGKLPFVAWRIDGDLDFPWRTQECASLDDDDIVFWMPLPLPPITAGERQP